MHTLKITKCLINFVTNYRSQCKIWHCSNHFFLCIDNSSIIPVVYKTNMCQKKLFFTSGSAGGLGLVNIQFKSISLLIRSFLETAIIPTLKHNQFHTSLYQWFVDGKSGMISSSKPAYHDDTFFEYIREVKQEGLLNYDFWHVVQGSPGESCHT